MSSTRSVSFVEHLELEFNGCVFKEALSLGDVDNDGGNELIVGNVDGELSIFKGDCAKPWKMCRNLGMVTCLGVGDVFNKGRNYLVCMTAEGWCHVFDVGKLLFCSLKLGFHERRKRQKHKRKSPYVSYVFVKTNRAQA